PVDDAPYSKADGREELAHLSRRVLADVPHVADRAQLHVLLVRTCSTGVCAAAQQKVRDPDQASQVWRGQIQHAARLQHTVNLGEGEDRIDSQVLEQLVEDDRIETAVVGRDRLALYVASAHV